MRGKVDKQFSPNKEQNVRPYWKIEKGKIADNEAKSEN